MHNSKFAASFDESELDLRAARITGAREKSMVAFLETVQQKWDGTEGYFKEVLGLDRETLEKVRDVMTVYEKNTTTMWRSSVESELRGSSLAFHDALNDFEREP
jgi:hypothetical protein